eukprot:CAMPEP_0170180050 /NCGR_PEP_ID=MMETSP0040_2-20121228/20270_1 /TAXON_ID=641309 /ORGANISM="Lotharella oceanica, Strain CCMP622" /LENGTH=278 /DNA_ID=CAMNT_0010424503 /DNA_START=63 /DNA_END=899 /DNA_ORIENTATION=-
MGSLAARTPHKPHNLPSRFASFPLGRPIRLRACRGISASSPGASSPEGGGTGTGAGSGTGTGTSMHAHPWDESTPLLVVVSRYGEDITWTDDVKHPVIVYEKETPSAAYNTPKNKAKEASSYLQFLSEQYNNLPEHVAFTHGSDTSWHHRGYLRNKLNVVALPATKPYKSFNRNRLNSIAKHPQHYFPHLPVYWSETLEPYFGPMDKLGDFTLNYKGSAQFLVPRWAIQARPQRLFQELYDWSMTTTMEDFWSSRMLEYTWHVLFDIDAFPLVDDAPR